MNEFARGHVALVLCVRSTVAESDGMSSVAACLLKRPGAEPLGVMAVSWLAWRGIGSERNHQTQDVTTYILRALVEVSAESAGESAVVIVCDRTFYPHIVEVATA